MLSKLNSISNVFYPSLSLVVSSSFLLINTSPSHANQIDRYSQQQNTNLANRDRAKYIIASHTVTASNHKVLPSTINLIKQYEGFRSYAYIDTSGLPVIGYGQSKINGRAVRMGQYITRAQADVALEREVYHIQKLVLANVKVKLTPHQLGALTSLVYNAGTRVIKRSTLSRKLNAGDYAGAAREFTRWNKANQGGRLVAMPGLTRRRVAEKNMFLTPYTSISAR